MADDSKKVAEVTQTVTGRGLVPFTSGLIIFIYAFFWPEEYGRWMGTIVKGFRNVAGFLRADVEIADHFSTGETDARIYLRVPQAD